MDVFVRIPTHKAVDKTRSYTINLAQNYWRCFSASCNEKNQGRKGGDVINFVALMENCREQQAAQKLAEWYGLNGNKTAPQIETRAEMSKEQTPHKDLPDISKPAVDGKSGFIASLDAWFNELFQLGEELVNDAFWVERRKAVKSKVYESFQNGKKAARL